MVIAYVTELSEMKSKVSITKKRTKIVRGMSQNQCLIQIYRKVLIYVRPVKYSPKCRGLRAIDKGKIL